jgi:hypothetical protein
MCGARIFEQHDKIAQFFRRKRNDFLDIGLDARPRRYVHAEARNGVVANRYGA